MSVDAVRGEYHRDTALHATGMLRDFNRAGLLTAADTHVASRVGAAVGENDESVLLAVAFAVRAARQGSVCVDLASLPADDGLGWPDAEGWGESRGRQPGGRIRGGPSRPGSAVPGPVLARGAPGGRRPRRAGHPAGRRRPGRAGGRARRGVPRRRIPGAARRRRGGLHAPDQHRHRRTGDREDDDHRAAHRDPRRHRGIGPAGGPRGTDREGGRAHLAGRAHGSGQARLPLRGKGSRGRAHGDNPAPSAGLATREPDPVPSRPPQPAALRRGRRRRDVDGVADPAGPPPRGDPAARTPRPGRRPGPADVGRGRRRPPRPRRRARPAQRLGGPPRDEPPLPRGDRRPGRGGPRR